MSTNREASLVWSSIVQKLTLDVSRVCNSYSVSWLCHCFCRRSCRRLEFSSWLRLNGTLQAHHASWLKSVGTGMQMGGRLGTSDLALEVVLHHTKISGDHSSSHKYRGPHSKLFFKVTPSHYKLLAGVRQFSSTAFSEALHFDEVKVPKSWPLHFGSITSDNLRLSGRGGAPSGEP